MKQKPKIMKGTNDLRMIFDHLKEEDKKKRREDWLKEHYKRKEEKNDG